MKRSFLLLLILALLGGCSQPALITTSTLPEPAVTISERTATPSPSATTTAMVTPTAGALTLPEPPQNRPHYQLDLTLNYYTHYGIVDEIITYTNNTGEVLSQLVLMIPPVDYRNSYVQNTLAGERVKSFLAQGHLTTIELTEPLNPGESTRLTLNYRLDIPESDGTYGVCGRQINLSNWYPFIPPYRAGVGFITHELNIEQATNSVVGENVFNEISDFDVSLMLTDRAELIEVAASAPAEGTNGNYKYHLELARSFSFSISDSFFEYEIEHDGIRIHSYVFMNEIETGKAVTEIASKALDLFGELFYPYPRQMISIVAADFLHNMEMDGMVMISYGVFDFYDNTPENNLTILTPHELSHQWIYSMVGNDQAAEPWLDETIAIYCEFLFYQKYYPDLAQWWWTNRIDQFNPDGFVNTDIYSPGGYEAYRNTVYLHGAQFMQELRDQVGDEAFFAALKDYVSTNTYKIATRQDFFDAISRHSQADLTSLLAKYFKN